MRSHARSLDLILDPAKWAHLGLNQAEGIPHQTTEDDSNRMELGEGGQCEGDADRLETTRFDSALGQPVDKVDRPRLDDDPRSKRGPSGSTATPPGGAGDEPVRRA